MHIQCLLLELGCSVYCYDYRHICAVVLAREYVYSSNQAVREQRWHKQTEFRQEKHIDAYQTVIEYE